MDPASQDAVQARNAVSAPASPPKTTRDRRLGRALLIASLQISLVTAFLAAWQFLPQVPGLSSKTHLLDPFFISSPTRVFRRTADSLTGQHGSFVIWPYLAGTVWAGLAGMAIGMVLGTLLGLVLSTSRFISDVTQPFVVALNAVPRIALIPIVIILAGPTWTASVIVAVMVVFFVAFFNAYEGGRTVAPHLIQNSTILGASRWQVMWHVRLPYVVAWALAALPLAATFAIISVVTGEILTGYPGMGALINISYASADSSLTFAVVIILSVVGIAVVGAAELIKQRILHWWGVG